MIAHMLNRSVDVYREQRGPDGSGGTVASWELVAASVGARFSQPTAEERITAQQAGSELSASVYLDARADVRRGDEVRASDTEVFRVVSLVRPSVAAYLRADCERVQGKGVPWPVAHTFKSGD